jgi:PAS domain-containing protein
MAARDCPLVGSGVRWCRIAVGEVRRSTAPGGPRHVRVTGTSLDITARKHAEAALRASEERARAAIHACRMGAWERDVLHNAVSSLAVPA